MRGNLLTTESTEGARGGRAGALQARLELDPDNADAMIGIAATRIFQVVNLYQIAGREWLLDEAEASISRAMCLVGDHIGVMKGRAMLLRARWRFADAIIT